MGNQTARGFFGSIFLFFPFNFKVEGNIHIGSLALRWPPSESILALPKSKKSLNFLNHQAAKLIPRTWTWKKPLFFCTDCKTTLSFYLKLIKRDLKTYLLECLCAWRHGLVSLTIGWARRLRYPACIHRILYYADTAGSVNLQTL